MHNRGAYVLHLLGDTQFMPCSRSIAAAPFRNCRCQAWHNLFHHVERPDVAQTQEGLCIVGKWTKVRQERIKSNSSFFKRTWDIFRNEIVRFKIDWYRWLIWQTCFIILFFSFKISVSHSLGGKTSAFIFLSSSNKNISFKQLYLLHINMS